MAEPIIDKLALEIAARRRAGAERRKAEAELTAQAPAVLVVAAEQEPAAHPGGIAGQPVKYPSDTAPASKEAATVPEIAEAINAITSNSNPFVSARLLAAILTGGASRKELLERIDKSQSWLSKRLGLLNAPKEFQRLIESGEMSERAYHEDRLNAKAGIKGRGTTLRNEHKPNVSINFEAAFAVASILRTLAAQHGAMPISLDTKTKKKDITTIINMRADELRRVLK